MSNLIRTGSGQAIPGSSRSTPRGSLPLDTPHGTARPPADPAWAPRRPADSGPFLNHPTALLESRSPPAAPPAAAPWWRRAARTVAPHRRAAIDPAAGQSARATQGACPYGWDLIPGIRSRPYVEIGLLGVRVVGFEDLDIAGHLGDDSEVRPEQVAAGDDADRGLGGVGPPERGVGRQSRQTVGGLAL